MKRRVVWSPTARGDLLAIASHIAADNPRAARSVSARLRSVGEKLGEAATGRPGRVSGTYEKSVSGLPYVIAYALVPSDAAETVAILHIIHTAREWPPEAWPG